MMKPTVIYISGAPGSGKTTLGKLLSDELYIPLVSSDLIHGGRAFTDPEHDREQTLKTIFIPLLVNYADKGVSFIIDHVLQRGLSETWIIDRLKPYANLINIHLMTTDPISRYERRTLTSSLPSIVSRRDELLSRVDHHRANLTVTEHPLDIDIPQLIVQTDQDYDPNLQMIVTFIKNHPV